MNRRILWIEDDYQDIKGLVWPLEKAGFTVDSATSALDGYQMAQHWPEYDLIVLDLILPLTNDHDTELPPIVQSWKKEPQVGIGILKWLRRDLKVACPVVILSVLQDPVTTYHLEDDVKPAKYLPKRGLLPATLKQTVFKLLGLTDEEGSLTGIVDRVTHPDR